MNDLRKAAEIALAHLESISDWDCTYPIGKAKDALRQALAQPEREQYVTRVVAMHEDGTYTTERTPLLKEGR